MSIGETDRDIRISYNLRVGGQKAINSRNMHVGSFTNLATAEDWAVSSTGNGAAALGGTFSNNGASNENSIIQDYDPWGRPSLVWRALNNDAGSNSDGGWNKNVSNLDGNKSYMFVTYVKRESSQTSGTYYFGCSGGETLNMSGSANGNPYFHAFGISSLPQGVWCLAIGFVYANNHPRTSSSGLGGVWRLDTGQKIATSTDYKMRYTGTRSQTHRTYLYYSTDSNSQLKWWGPGVYEINGNEPNIEQLSGNRVSQGGLYLDSPNGITMPAYGGGTVRFRTNTHWDSRTGIDFIGTGTDEFRMSSDGGNLNLRVDGWMYNYDVTYSPRYYDQNNTGYYADPASTSYFNDMRANIYYDRDNTSYYANPGQTSYFNDIRTNIIYDRENTAYYFGSGQGDARMNTARAWNFYADDWFRNYNQNEGLYNQSSGNHWYSSGAYWAIGYTGSSKGIIIRDGFQGTVRGYFYATDSNEIGLLDSDGNWAVRVVRDSYVELRDNNEVTFRVGQGG